MINTWFVTIEEEDFDGEHSSNDHICVQCSIIWFEHLQNLLVVQLECVCYLHCPSRLRVNWLSSFLNPLICFCLDLQTMMEADEVSNTGRIWLTFILFPNSWIIYASLYNHLSHVILESRSSWRLQQTCLSVIGGIHSVSWLKQKPKARA